MLSDLLSNSATQLQRQGIVVLKYIARQLLPAGVQLFQDRGIGLINWETE